MDGVGAPEPWAPRMVAARALSPMGGGRTSAEKSEREAGEGEGGQLSRHPASASHRCRVARKLPRRKQTSVARAFPSARVIPFRRPEMGPARLYEAGPISGRRKGGKK